MELGPLWSSADEVAKGLVLMPSGRRVVTPQLRVCEPEQPIDRRTVHTAMRHDGEPHTVARGRGLQRPVQDANLSNPAQSVQLQFEVVEPVTDDIAYRPS